MILELRTRSGAWFPVTFRVDTGTSLTSMSVKRAEAQSPVNLDGLDLATTLTPRRIDKTLGDGSTRTVEMQLGTLTARFPELRAFVFKWECLFDPTLDPERALLGIGGQVLTDASITFRGANQQHMTGSVTFEILTRPVPLFPLSEALVWECRYAPAGWPTQTDPMVSPPPAPTEPT